MTAPDPTPPTATRTGLHVAGAWARACLRSIRWPRGWLHWASALLVWLVLLSYLGTWLRGNWTYLTDVDWQTDDVRTALFPFHRYRADHALADDPISEEMVTYIPWAVRALFWLTVPLVGLAAASKISQGLCLLVIVCAGALIVRQRRAGLGAGALLVFLFLRDSFVVDRIASGLPRAYGFPAIALWSAGALASRLSLRRLGIVLGALTYPSALAMTLGAEGLFVVQAVFRRSKSHTLRTAKRLLVTTALAVLCVSPAVFGGRAEDGHVHTLEQAQQEPAFGKSGRLWILPFADGRTELSKHFAQTFSAQGATPLPALAEAIKPHAGSIAMALIALVILLAWMGLSPPPAGAIAVSAGSALLYCLSCVLAFRLYSPERYYSYGMRAAGLLLLLNVVSLVGYRLRSRLRYVTRNLACAVAMLGLWLCLGDGIVERNGLTINRRWGAPLYEFVETLPLDVRIASHPSDGDDLPYFAARATLGGYETLQPWLTGSWARQKKRAEDALTAFYATRQADVLAYLERYGATHVLVNTARYQSDFVKASRTFEPLTSFARRLLNNVQREDLVFAHVPESAVLFSHKSLRLISVAKLREAWNGTDGPTAPSPSPTE